MIGSAQNSRFSDFQESLFYPQFHEDVEALRPIRETYYYRRHRRGIELGLGHRMGEFAIERRAGVGSIRGILGSSLACTGSRPLDSRCTQSADDKLGENRTGSTSDDSGGIICSAR